MRALQNAYIHTCQCMCVNALPLILYIPLFLVVIWQNDPKIGRLDAKRRGGELNTKDTAQ